jgi:hypothetical protein
MAGEIAAEPGSRAWTDAKPDDTDAGSRGPVAVDRSTPDARRQHVNPMRCARYRPAIPPDARGATGRCVVAFPGGIGKAAVVFAQARSIKIDGRVVNGGDSRARAANGWTIWPES